MTMASASAERPSRSIVTMFSALSSSREERMRARSVGSCLGAAVFAAPFLAVLRVRSGSSFVDARGNRLLNRNGRLVLCVTHAFYHIFPLFRHGRAWPARPFRLCDVRDIHFDPVIPAQAGTQG